MRRRRDPGVGRADYGHAARGRRAGVDVTGRPAGRLCADCPAPRRTSLAWLDGAQCRRRRTSAGAHDRPAAIAAGGISRVDVGPSPRLRSRGRRADHDRARRRRRLPLHVGRDPSTDSPRIRLRAHDAPDAAGASAVHARRIPAGRGGTPGRLLRLSGRCSDGYRAERPSPASSCRRSSPSSPAVPV